MITLLMKIAVGLTALWLFLLPVTITRHSDESDVDYRLRQSIKDVENTLSFILFVALLGFAICL